MLLRPGAITLDQLRAQLHGTRSRGCGSGAREMETCAKSAGKGKSDATREEEQVRSPGTRYRHYAPAVPVKLFRRDQTGASSEVSEDRRDGSSVSRVVVLVDSEPISPESDTGSVTSDANVPVGNYFVRLESYRDLTRELYRLLVKWESRVDEIWIEQPPDTPEYAGILDRLRRAADQM